MNGVSRDVQNYQFADDIALFISKQCIITAKNKLEKAIEKLTNNLTELGLQLAPQKTQLIHFNNKKNHTRKYNYSNKQCAHPVCTKRELRGTN